MSEIVNLRRARKALARKQAQATAAANRAAHGRSKATKALEQAQSRLAERRLDGVKREEDE